MGCNEHLIGKPNCHADHQRGTTCGQSLTVDIQMYFQKVNPQQEEGKFFGGPVKAHCRGGWKIQFAIWTDFLQRKITVNTERECPVTCYRSPLSQQSQFPPSSDYVFAWMTLKSEDVPLGNKLGKCSPFSLSTESEIVLFCYFFLLNFAFSSSFSQNQLITILNKTFTWTSFHLRLIFCIGYVENKLHTCKFQPGVEHYAI